MYIMNVMREVYAGGTQKVLTPELLTRLVSPTGPSLKVM